jgi:uncharacterized RDD family membrane protein YckC
MSDTSQGPGWWQASDGKWYPPEQAPGAQPTAPPTAAPTGPPPGAPPAGYGAPAPAYGAPAYGAPAAAPGQLAEWPQRALSGLIDFVGISIISNVVALSSRPLGNLIGLLGFAFALYNAYLNGSTGQSIGKKVVGTRVVSEATGQPIGGGLGIVRYFAHIIDLVICFVGFLFPLWDAKKQTIADKVMKTVVITGAQPQSLGDAFKG